MNFLMVCGGTAGHINPALAIAAEMRRRVPDAKLLFVGADKEMEKKLIPRAGFHLVNIRMSGIRRKISPEDILFNMNTFRNLATAGVKSENLISRFGPSAVIGTGGYICYPVLKKAAQMGIPTVVHGSDAVPGLTTKLLSATVDRVLVSFPGMESLYRKPDRVVFTGTPVREGFESLRDAEGKDKRDGKPLVVSFWGSQGAERMNEIIAEFIKLNSDDCRFDHIHATGKSGADEMRKRVARLGVSGELPPGIEIRDYIDDMPSVMNSADVVLCRAGASTIAELAIIGKPAVLVPSPYVTNNHQEENARQLEKAGGAVVLLEKECTGKSLFEAVSSIIGDSDRLTRMSYAQKSLAAPNAAGKIVDIVMALCAEKMEN